MTNRTTRWSDPTATTGMRECQHKPLAIFKSALNTACSQISQRISQTQSKSYEVSWLSWQIRCPAFLDYPKIRYVKVFSGSTECLDNCEIPTVISVHAKHRKFHCYAHKRRTNKCKKVAHHGVGQQCFSAALVSIVFIHTHKKAQLSLTNPRDAKACQNCSNSTCLQRCRWQYWPIFNLHAFNCYCVRNPEKFTENSSLWSSRSSKVIDIGVNRKPICDLLLVINSNFSRICCRFRDIHG